MQQLFLCPQGHRWETDPDQRSSPSAGLVCPICGQKTDTTAFQELPNANNTSFVELHQDPQETTAFQELPPQPPGHDAATRESTAVTPLVQAPARDLSTAVMPRFPGLRREALARPWPAIPDHEILEEIGRGETGVVYKVRQLSTQAVVALKQIVSGYYAEPKNFARLRADLQKVAKLQHPCIAQIHQVDEYDGRMYVVQEYVDGGNLRQKSGGKPQPASQSAQIVETLARAVHYATQQGIEHRGLKPSNVLLTSDGTPKITDFGITPRPDTAGPRLNGALPGNPSYLAPEQVTEQVDAGSATDVYALGAILYELLTGRPPFQAVSPAETLELLQSEEALAPSRFQLRVPQKLETICLKCLQRDPARRYASSELLADDLRRFLVGQPIQARPASIWERSRKWMGRWPKTAAALLIVIGGLLALLVSLRSTGARLRAELATVNTEKDQAQKQIEDTRRHLYLADMIAAQEAWERAEIDRTLSLLEKHRGEEGLRSFEWAYLWRLCHSERHALNGHVGAINALAYSPNNVTVATGGGLTRDGKTVGDIRLWDAVGGKEEAAWQTATGPVTALAFAPLGRLLASAVQDGGIQIWDRTTQKETRKLAGHEGAVTGLAFSADGKTLFSCSLDGTARVWDVEVGKERAALRGHTGGATSLALLPDGKSLAVACAGDSHTGGLIKLWNLSQFKERAVLQGYRGPVSSLAVTSDGKTLLSGGKAGEGVGEIKLWDLAINQVRFELPAAFDGIGKLACSADGHMLAVGSEAAAVQLWSLDGVPHRLITLKGHSGMVNALSFSPDGLTLATAGADGVAKLWSTAQALGGPTLRGHTEVVNSLSFAANSITLASSAGEPGRPGEVKLWDVVKGAEQVTLNERQQRAVLAVALASRGQASNDPEQALHPGKNAGTTKENELEAKLLALAGEDPEVRVIDLDTGANRTTLRGPSLALTCVAFTPAGDLVAVGSADTTVWIWFSKGSKYDSFQGHMEHISSLAFAPNGSSLAYSGTNKLAMVYDVATRQQRITLKGHTGAVTSVAYSPDGKTIATGSRDQTVRLWDAANGKQIAVFTGPTHWVTSVAFCPDGKSIAAGSRDGEVHLWDIQTGSPRLVLRAQRAAVLALAFSPDGHTLAAAGADKTVKLFRADPQPTLAAGTQTAKKD
jgi:WD40 repeat protein